MVLVLILNELSTFQPYVTKPWGIGLQVKKKENFFFSFLSKNWGTFLLEKLFFFLVSLRGAFRFRQVAGSENKVAYWGQG